MSAVPTVGIIGGSGALGSAIAKGLLRNGYLTPEQLWISNRSGNAAGFDESPGIHFTSSNQTLVDACDIVIVSVPPHLAPSIGIHAENRLIISVMAGVSIEQLQQFSGSDRVVRAISNPAADIGLAYSPWCVSAGVTDQDREWTRSVFGAFGQTDEVPNEDQIDHFTALIGPVPGFVAYFADCMVGYAVKNEIDPKVAERAIRQLFHSSGVVLAESEASPTEHVNAMIDYAGTTAAGLEAMKASPLADFVEQGLKAAYLKAKDIG
ncbi:pyrroline-5-carboxylate reductase family protein [Leucothrix mucor]|uniref:pyrroline-5-carboxylate reductase family protein n=1 Tax=Leucothrix mucor TaxID=45248 RepID=UPI0003B3EF82|nr:pyrroline-5-carboxylate reductase [Leucothrix mucor]